VNKDEIVHVLVPLVEAFDKLQIAYYIGGSVASSIYGEPRQTQDADVVADIHLNHVRSLVSSLQAEYYIDADMIRDAIHRRSSFNIIHFDSMLKVDIFIPKPRPFTQQELRRSRAEIIAVGSRPFILASPEDTILNKLEWYKMSDGVSSRQWGDILGVLGRKGSDLDFAYLRHWADNLGVADLLERAVTEAGTTGETSL